MADRSRTGDLLEAVLPLTRRLHGYGLHTLRADVLSGLTVALVLIPQSMAYAQLAGLPPYYGLYAAFLPPVVAALFGSSSQLATGPVAVVSLMTATALEPLASAGSGEYVAYALLLAVTVGLFQLLLGVLRLGMVVNLLSHPVVNGFTNAAALIIASSQLAKIFGVSVEKAEHQYETVWRVCRAAVHCTHWPTFLMAALAFALILGLRKIGPRVPSVLVAVVATTLISWLTGFEHSVTTSLDAVGTPEIVRAINRLGTELETSDRLAAERRVLTRRSREAQPRSGPGSRRALELQHEIDLIDLNLTEARRKATALRRLLKETLFVRETGPDGNATFIAESEAQADAGRRWRLTVGATPIDPERLTWVGGGAVVGVIPSGLPGFQAPRLEPAKLLHLLPMAIIISILGFMEAISIAKAMAARTGELIDPNQELVGQGLANLVGSMFGSYPVSGSFSRSAVNLQAGAVTGLSNVASAAVVVITLLFLTPLLFHLPQSVLAAIIMVAVVGLVNTRAFVHAWRTQRHDGLIAVVTFVATLVAAPHLEKGIFLGVALTLALYLFRTMKPAVALLSKYTDGSFRNALLHGLGLCRHIAVIRFNGSLFFSNVSYLEEQILERVAAMPDLRHVLIVGNGINEIDASGEEMLRRMVVRLREAGYDVSLSGLNDPVLQVLRRTGLERKIGPDHLYRSVAMALESLWEPTHAGTDEAECPLATPRFTGLPVASGAQRRDEILRGPPPPPPAS